MELDRFSQPRYQIHKQFLKLFGGAFRVYDTSGALALYADMKAFRLKEDIRLYTNEAKTMEVLSIQARQIIDISATYDVYDSATRQKVGALRRRGLKSMFLQDEWVILDAYDNEVGMLQEDKLLLSLLRRHVTNLIPQTFHAQVGGMPAFTFTQHFNPFVLKMDLDFTPDVNYVLDRRLGIAAAVLLCAIEGRQR